MPLQRRVPKFGFKNINRKEYKGVNVSTLQELADSKKLTEITVETLIEAGQVRKNSLVKILGNGELKSKLTVKAHAFSKSAVEAIEAKGGSCRANLIEKIAMKKFIETIRNIWKIEDLRARIIYTLGIILIYRLGTHIVLPGINPVIIADMAKGRQNTGGILDLLNLFTGGAFARASIFGLGIMPYISASIVVQLLGIAVPYFQRLQREGESGRRKINQITRYLTVAILIPQGLSYITSLRYQLPAEAFTEGFSRMASMLILTAGTMFIMWLGEKITDKGIGNGISLIIMIGIIARLPQSLGYRIYVPTGKPGWRSGCLPCGDADHVRHFHGNHSAGSGYPENPGSVCQAYCG